MSQPLAHCRLGPSVQRRPYCNAKSFFFFFAHCSHKLSDSLSHIINSLDKNNNIDHYSAHALFSRVLFLFPLFLKIIEKKLPHLHSYLDFFIYPTVYSYFPSQLSLHFCLHLQFYCHFFKFSSFSLCNFFLH